MIVPLQNTYAARYGVPVIDKVDTDVFLKSYYGDCMACNFCHDACCAHGADTTAIDMENMESHAAELAAYRGLCRDRRFTGKFEDDSDWPGGRATRIRVEDGHCVFLNTAGRGCLIHSFALERGIDVHEVKPMVCLMWPVTWTDATLFCSNEVADNDLICVGPGQTCYRSARTDLQWYFGPAMIAELDALEAKVLHASNLTPPRAIPLPLLAPQ